MDAKEINEKSKALMKATQAGESPSIIIGILKELKTGVVASEDVLRSTKIGVTVNKSKIHKNPEVARLAAEIVRKWRDDIAKQKGISTTPANAKPGRSTPKRGTASPAPTFEKSKPTSTAPSVPPDQRTWKKDKIDTAKTGQATRDSCIGLMYDGLVHLSTAPSSTVLNMAIAVEQAMYKAHGPEDKPSYKEKIRSLYQNLKAKNNPGLRLKIMSGEITPEKFVVMTSQELKSETLKAEEAKLQKENMNNARVPQEEKSISTALRCSKCGQKKVSYTQAQTRSADEPMTTFCECVVCGNRWKVFSLLLTPKYRSLWWLASDDDGDDGG
ncbi:MAG: RNA polymerase II elongation factor [Icmadophila ericetorum]|nr:RNA polymerase II elongation factor [Icmadophila ericetorum]